MKIVEISKGEFDVYEPHRDPIPSLIIEERKWFATDDRVLLGVLTFDKPDSDWGYIVLGRDEHERFRAIHCAVSMVSESDAEQALKAIMETTGSSGESVFPQE